MFRRKFVPNIAVFWSKHFCLHPELVAERCMVKAITIRLQIRLGMERFGSSNNSAQQLQNRCTESMSSDQSVLNDGVGPRAKSLQAKKMQMSNRCQSNRRGNKTQFTESRQPPIQFATQKRFKMPAGSEGPKLVVFGPDDHAARNERPRPRHRWLENSVAVHSTASNLD